ncbi:hypothetical protein Bhyg_12120 [Pseudolycoriella hygida]|uniref:Uncharacterized protein n=1 Tax=Pseudolycoriella hygida TaxID=35572 RepID=A0A9Q0S0K0_9DIPT|nr:hypothetical protein Bhyg_12120 [Pseudolycoriella hygida]
MKEADSAEHLYELRNKKPVGRPKKRSLAGTAACWKTDINDRGFSSDIFRDASDVIFNSAEKASENEPNSSAEDI